MQCPEIVVLYSKVCHFLVCTKTFLTNSDYTVHTCIRSICKAHEKQKSRYAPTGCGKKQRAVVTAVEVSTYWSMMPEFDSVTEV